MAKQEIPPVIPIKKSPPKKRGFVDVHCIACGLVQPCDPGGDLPVLVSGNPVTIELACEKCEQAFVVTLYTSPKVEMTDPNEPEQAEDE